MRYLISQVVDFPQHALAGDFNFLEKTSIFYVIYFTYTYTSTSTHANMEFLYLLP